MPASSTIFVEAVAPLTIRTAAAGTPASLARKRTIA